MQVDLVHGHQCLGFLWHARTESGRVLTFGQNDGKTKEEMVFFRGRSFTEVMFRVQVGELQKTPMKEKQIV